MNGHHHFRWLLWRGAPLIVAQAQSSDGDEKRNLPKWQQRNNSDSRGIVPLLTSSGYSSPNRSSGLATDKSQSSQVTRNPAVMIGLVLTVLALLGMIKKSLSKDMRGTQKFMRYRIVAQYFTIMSMVVGMFILSVKKKQ